MSTEKLEVVSGTDAQAAAELFRRNVSLTFISGRRGVPDRRVAALRNELRRSCRSRRTTYIGTCSSQKMLTGGASKTLLVAVKLPAVGHASYCLQTAGEEQSLSASVARCSRQFGTPNLCARCCSTHGEACEHLSRSLSGVRCLIGIGMETCCSGFRV